jgi:AraC-like DNA-binding protein
MTWQRTVPMIRDGGAGHPLTVYRNSLARHRDFRSDMHYELEVGVVLSGTMERACSDHHALVGRGQVWLCGMWEPHRYRVASRHCEVLVLVIRPDALAGVRVAGDDFRWLSPFSAPPKLRPQARGRLRTDVVAWGERMTRTLTLPERTRAREQQLLLLELITMLCRGWEAPPQARNGDATRIERAITALFDKRGDLTAIDASRAVGLSRNRFNREFIALMGVSFVDFAMRYRLSGVASDLVHGDEPLKAIARAWSFTDASHLGRRFREYYECTPAEYRKRKMAGG